MTAYSGDQPTIISILLQAKGQVLVQIKQIMSIVLVTNGKKNASLNVMSDILIFCYLTNLTVNLYFGNTHKLKKMLMGARVEYT